MSAVDAVPGCVDSWRGKAIRGERVGEQKSMAARLAAALRTIVPSYFDLIARILRLIAREHGVKVPLALDRLMTPTVDARLAKLEDARRYLLESLEAVDELKRDAEQNKRDLERALEELQATMADRDAAHEELRSIRSVMSADIAAFRNLAGVPNVMKERVIGCVAGIIASLVATILWVAVTNLAASPATPDIVKDVIRPVVTPAKTE